MKYTTSNLKRTFIVKFEHNDDFLLELTNLIKKENIKAGLINLLGALQESEFVVGPKENKIPPEAIFNKLEKPRELLGIGTIFWKDNEPKVHLHTGIGREDKVNIGCIRKNSKIFLIIEAIIFELDSTAKRVHDETTGLDLLDF